MVQKLLMEIPDSDLRDLHQGTETGMGFHIIEGPHGAQGGSHLKS